MTIHNIATGKTIDSGYTKELLSDLLKQAEAGSIAAIGVSIVFLDGATENAFGVDAQFNPDSLIGSLERLKVSLIDSTSGEVEEMT